MLGVQRDVEMGPVVMFGLGGVLIELFKDVAFAPAFLDHAQARAMVQSTRAGRLLQGFRGGKPADIDALCDALVNLGRLARELGDVIEADRRQSVPGARTRRIRARWPCGAAPARST